MNLPEFPEPPQLPYFLRPFWEHRLVDPRKASSYCETQARKTPWKPWHNGETHCTACGCAREPNGSWRTSA